MCPPASCCPPTSPWPAHHAAAAAARSVTSLAALLLTLGALLFEGASLAAAGMHGVFGWAASPHYLPYVLYLALGPGIVGHTGEPDRCRCAKLWAMHGEGFAWATSGPGMRI